MFNIKKMLEDNGHEVIPFSIHSNKNVEAKYSKYFVEPIGGRDATYFDEVKKTPKSIWQLLTRSIYSREVEKAIKKEINDVKPDLVYIIHFVNKLSPSVITGASKMGIPVVLRLSDYFLLCPRFDFMYEKKVCEECLSKGYRSCIKKRCVKGSLFASVVRVFSMKFHKMINVYKNVYAFITPSEFLKKKLALNGFDEKRIHLITNRDDLKTIDPTKKYVMTNQTTMSLYDVYDLCEKAKEILPFVEIEKETCTATKIRQEAIKNIEDIKDSDPITYYTVKANGTKQLFLMYFELPDETPIGFIGASYEKNSFYSETDIFYEMSVSLRNLQRLFEYDKKEK